MWDVDKTILMMAVVVGVIGLIVSFSNGVGLSPGLADGAGLTPGISFKECKRSCEIDNGNNYDDGYRTCIERRCKRYSPGSEWWREICDSLVRGCIKNSCPEEGEPGYQICVNDCRDSESPCYSDPECSGSDGGGTV